MLHACLKATHRHICLSQFCAKNGKKFIIFSKTLTNPLPPEFSIRSLNDYFFYLDKMIEVMSFPHFPQKCLSTEYIPCYIIICVNQASTNTKKDSSKSLYGGPLSMTSKSHV